MDVIDLRKPRELSAGEVLDQMNKRPTLTAEDLNYATPLGDVVFVQAKQPPARSPGGVLLASQPVPNRGVVVAVGPGNTTISGVVIAIDLAVGDEVQFMQQSFANQMQVNGHPVIPLHENEIVCKFKAPEAAKVKPPLPPAPSNAGYRTPAADRVE